MYGGSLFMYGVRALMYGVGLIVQRAAIPARDFDPSSPKLKMNPPFFIEDLQIVHSQEIDPKKRNLQLYLRMIQLYLALIQGLKF